MLTTPDEFQDFHIEIIPKQAGEYTVHIHLGGGGDFYGSLATEGLLPWVSSGNLTEDGQRLFKALLADSQLSDAWKKALPKRRIRLHIAPDAAELHTLPWELLHDDEGWLATNDATPLSRFLPTRHPWERPLTAYPIRVLLAISNPVDLADLGLTPIDAEWERNAFATIFKEFTRRKLVHLEPLPGPMTLANLDSALGAGDGYHIVHVIAHGMFNRKDNQTALYLQTDDGYAHLVEAEKFTAMLRQQRLRPHLVFLSVCHSAAWGTADVAAGLGPQLIAAGIPVVVAMQDAVDIVSARNLTLHFYRHLLQHGAVDRALNTARRNLDAAWRSDASAPVLLMHLEDARILDLEEAKFALIGEKFVERVRSIGALFNYLQKWRDTTSYLPDMRQLAGTLLNKRAESPTLEQLRRDIPWLLSLGVLVAYIEDVEITISVPGILELLRRPRTERELPAPPQPPAPKQASSASKPSSGRRMAPSGDWAPELVHIPAGNFLMGTTERQAAALQKQFGEKTWYKFEWETPQRTLYLPDYYIGKYPVTNAQYYAFVQDTGHRAPGYWDAGQIPRGKENHPVKRLYWKDAVAYCEWLTERIQDAGCKIKVWRAGVLVTEVLPRASCIVRLPTEAEWEKAARGPNGFEYPWGNTPPTEHLCNFDNKVKDTTPIGAYSPHGDSPYGCADMAGNVWEWTSTRWGPKWEEPQFRYPYRADDGREDMRSDDYRIARGGNYWNSQEYLRCAFRNLRYWNFYGNSVTAGLRVCVAAPFSHPFGL